MVDESIEVVSINMRASTAGVKTNIKPDTKPAGKRFPKKSKGGKTSNSEAASANKGRGSTSAKADKGRGSNKLNKLNTNINTTNGRAAGKANTNRGRGASKANKGKTSSKAAKVVDQLVKATSAIGLAEGGSLKRKATR
jgi:hypothetical protein